MQDHELDSYLNGTVITDEQRARFLRAFENIEAIYPRADEDFEENSEAGAGATMFILGDDTLDGLATEHAAARDKEHIARYRLHGALIAAVQDGMSESEAARVSGLSRMTIRKLLGK